jgi:hypothetical protein
MRSNIIYTFAAVFAAFSQFAAVFAAFALPVPAIADQPAGAIGTVSVTQEQSVRGVVEVIVEGRRAT